MQKSTQTRKGLCFPEFLAKVSLEWYNESMDETKEIFAMKLFSLDSPVGRAIALIADLCVLNVVFVLSCLPLVTVGAACAGLYDTVHQLLLGEGTSVVKTYAAAFRRCFLRGTGGFFLSVLAGVILWADLVCAGQLDGAMGLVCLGVILASGWFFCAWMAHVPMVMCRRDGSIRAVGKEALGAMLANGVRTVIPVGLNLLPWGLVLFAPVWFLKTAMFWAVLGFALCAFCNNWLLLKGVDPETWEALRPKKNKI